MPPKDESKTLECAGHDGALNGRDKSRPPAESITLRHDQAQDQDQDRPQNQSGDM